MPQEDAALTAMVDGTAEKVMALSEEEWKELKTLLPFPEAVTAEDDVYKEEA